ncbi:MAG: hypothetical protein J1F40_08730, partial [Prevotellaceae bacterium]|nr:hypothetical protein [Prevotellaceae bacterium]
DDNKGNGDDDNKGNGDDDNNGNGDDDDKTGVNSVISADSQGKTIYNINGQPVNSVKNGEVYIIKYSNGKTLKSINK